MAIEVAKTGSPVATSVRRSSGLPAASAFTACGWFKYVWSDLTTGSYSTAISLAIDSGAGTTNYITLYKDSGSGNILVAGQDAGAATVSGTIATISLNNWFFFAMVNQGTGANDLIGYVSAASSNTFSSQSTQGRTFTPTRIGFAYDPFTSGTTDNWSGDMAHLKVWSRALSLAELAVEKYSFWAQFRANLNTDSPCFNALDDNGTANDLRDYSGNGNHWTESDALRDHDNLSGNNIPPVPYGGRPLRLNTAPSFYQGFIPTGSPYDSSYVTRRRTPYARGLSMGVDVREWW